MREHLARLIVTACIISIAVPMMSATVEAEIPHENYEYVNPDLGVVLSLLNTSIMYFESSFTALDQEDVSGGVENLSAVNALLGPAESVLGDLAGIAESYDDLNSLIPAFAELADSEAVFIDLEESLLDARLVLRSLSGRTSLTDNETLLAMNAFNEASLLIGRMNASIDSMIVLAEEISLLFVDGEYPFSESNLVELIDSLRDLLYNVEVELVDLIEGGDGGEGDPGIAITPFLTLWVLDVDLHLGDPLTGGGYLYYDGSFQSGQEITVLTNGSALLTAATSNLGEFEFGYEIPLDPAWLGVHELSAYSSWSGGNLTSDSVFISVYLIPTSIVIGVNAQLLSHEETLELEVTLHDVRGDPVPDVEVSLAIDDIVGDVSLDLQGRYATSYLAVDLGIGTHTLDAEYGGGIPYAPCSSSTVTVTIDIPTSIELTLFSDNVYRGYHIVGEGVLNAETLESIDGMQIALLIDGFPVQNTTTDENGVFAFAIPTESIAVGDHVLKAEFSPEDAMWRHSEDEVEFRIYTTERTAKYPFWPIIPGWGNLGAPPEVAYNFFFGDYAYFGWLVIIGTIVVAVKTVRKRREALARRARLASVGHYLDSDDSAFGGSNARPGSGADPFDLVEPPEAPNERVVWSYNYLLRSLVRNRRLQIGASMTHREIAGMLVAFGYPVNLVNKATNLFEMARYSGIPMTESEMNAMGGVVEQLRSTVLGGRGYAT